MNLSGYKNIEKLKEGSQSLIYTALREEDNTPVVLKTFLTDRPSLDSIALLYHEFDITKDLDLPGVVQTFGLLEEQNQYVLVKEDTQAISLLDYLAGKPMGVDEFLPLALQMADILGALHQERIIHKDIKPSNFLINPKSKTLKLTDFNFATKLALEVQDIVSPDKIEGTLGYMAPEQTGRMNMSIDYRSDYYALGISFYQMLTGQMPFTADDPMGYVHCHIAIKAKALHEINPEIPKMISAIVGKLMNKEPNERYQSSIGLKDDLEICLEKWGELKKIASFELGTTDIYGHLNISQRLYGREQESQQLLATYEQVSQGDVLGLMVSGYSGIGKTMLINEVNKSMVAHHGYFISGKFDQLQKNKPYTAMTQAFNGLAQQIISEPPLVFEKIRSDILSVMGDVGQVIIEIFPQMEKVMGEQPPLQELPAQESQNRLMIFFKRFLNVVATQERPLVMFIDDLQWVDSGSLQLLEYILTDKALKYVLLIGAYRDNEVDQDHPLTLFLDERKSKIKALKLEPLALKHYQQLLADSLSCHVDEVKSFADVLYQKTEGNPFFAKQVIMTLYQEQILHFSYQDRQWQWNVDKVKALKISDNVVDLMIGKIANLPEDTQTLLKYAACIGNRFSIDLLATISEQSAEAIGKALWPAMQASLLQSRHLGYKRIEAMSRDDLAKSLSKEIIYQFIHDRVQQAVYQLLSDEDKPKVHIKIARLMLLTDPKAAQDELIFEVADHFNKAHALLTDDERITIAKMDYQAGMKASHANAYQPMNNYLKAGLKLTDESWWDAAYSLKFTLERDYAISLYYIGELEEAENRLQPLLQKAKNILDRVSIYRRQVVQYDRQGNPDAGVDIAIRALRLLGVKLTANPSWLTVMKKRVEVAWLLRRYSIDRLDTQLPDVTDEKWIAAFAVLTDNILSAYHSGKVKFLSLLTFTAMVLMLRYGKPDSAGLWMVTYSNLQVMLFKKVDRAMVFWRVAEKTDEE